MPIRIAVGDVMTRQYVSVTPSTDLHKCAKEMVKQRVDNMLISKGRKLLGILTSRDILWAMIKKPNIDLKKIKVTDISTKKVAVIKPSADISQALNKMKQVGFKRLPVLSKGQLVGMITLKDILKVDPTLYEQLGQLEEIKEETQKLRNIESGWETEGICNECGAFSELLKVEGRLLCPDCRDELY